VTDAPRFDHNPTTGESLGLLVEEQRTNSIRNSTMVGAVAGTPGTLPTNWGTATSAIGTSSQVVGVGTENGINYVDIKWSGTVSSPGSMQNNVEVATAIAAASGQSWTGSVYLRLVGGSLPGTLTLLVIERNAAGGFLTSSSLSPTVTSSPLKDQRYSLLRVFNNALTAFAAMRLDIAAASGVVVDFTLRIGLPQLEQGAFATSPILTSTAAVTRSADVASITGSAFTGFYNQNQITVYAETRQIGDILGFAFALSDGTDNNRIAQFRNTVTFTSRHTVAGSGFNPGNITISSSQTLARSAIASIAGSSGAAVNGVLATPSTPAAMPTVDRLQIALGAPASTPLNGTLRRLCCWGQRLPDSTLQQITQ